MKTQRGEISVAVIILLTSLTASVALAQPASLPCIDLTPEEVAATPHGYLLVDSCQCGQYGDYEPSEVNGVWQCVPKRREPEKSIKRIRSLGACKRELKKAQRAKP